MKRIAALLAALCLVACSKPVPPEKAAYVGLWRAQDISLRISQDGRVDYKRKNGSSSTSVSAPITEFKGDSFAAGIGPLTTTFTVTAAPHLDGTATKMTVDGVELTKVQ